MSTNDQSIDLKKDRKDIYQPPTTDFVEVVVPPMTFLAIDGHGDPNTSPDYAPAIEALYAVAYAVRFALKKRCGTDFVVGPVEGLWTSATPRAFSGGDKAGWDWTMMTALPDPVSAEDIEAGLAAAARKKPHLPVARVEARRIDEGRSLQVMHVGSYADEAPTLARLHDAVMPGLAVVANGPHHEIYLGDPRKVAPEKLKTVLRQPIRDAR